MGNAACHAVHSQDKPRSDKQISGDTGVDEVTPVYYGEGSGVNTDETPGAFQIGGELT